MAKHIDFCSLGISGSLLKWQTLVSRYAEILSTLSMNHTCKSGLFNLLGFTSAFGSISAQLLLNELKTPCGRL